MGWVNDRPPRSPLRRSPVSDEARAAQTLYPRNNGSRVVDATGSPDDMEDPMPSLASVPPKAQREIKRNALGSTLDTARKRLMEALRLADELGDATLHMHIGLAVNALDDGRSHLAESDDA